jgi:hypothetical protein
MTCCVWSIYIHTKTKQKPGIASADDPTATVPGGMLVSSSNVVHHLVSSRGRCTQYRSSRWDSPRARRDSPRGHAVRRGRVGSRAGIIRCTRRSTQPIAYIIRCTRHVSVEQRCKEMSKHEALSVGHLGEEVRWIRRLPSTRPFFFALHTHPDPDIASIDVITLAATGTGSLVKSTLNVSLKLLQRIGRRPGRGFDMFQVHKYSPAYKAGVKCMGTTTGATKSFSSSDKPRLSFLQRSRPEVWRGTKICSIERTCLTERTKYIPDTTIDHISTWPGRTCTIISQFP